MTTTPTTSVLARSVVVLETLAGMEQPAALPAVAERLGAPVSQTYRVLRALQEEGFVDHVGRRGYRVGTRAIGLGALLGPWPELRALTYPVLVRLAGGTSLSARLHVRSGYDRVLLLAAVPPHDHDPSWRTRIGERSPLTRGCSGRAILAHLPESEIEAVLGARAGEEDGTLRTELRRIRGDGFAFSSAANHAGRRGISVPLTSASEVMGALSLSGPQAAVDEDGLRRLAGTVRAAADDIAGPLSAMLGPDATRRRYALDVLPPEHPRLDR
ncbi:MULTISPECIES: IclR family transcriptional regulator [unclassified Pseudonocardia]|uniref:IclR family transcriptional regulator n=1 Tax=unclassified Pseudonocardia TaxID=2619320 RepID=UPI00117B03A4|nr:MULTISPECIES: IclR family transcriptional regulator C-terminal domain-containing protein [unclassified Pseudonocardia]